MKRTTKNEPRGTNHGFTLVEMMVVLSIFSLVIGIAFTVLSLNDTYRDLVLIKIRLYRQAKIAVDSISMELEKSASDKVFIEGTNVIRFQIPWVDANSPYAEHWGANNHEGFYIRYRLDNNNLVRDTLDTTPSVIATEIITENISDLQFTSLNPNYIKINVNGRKKTYQGREINSALQSSVYLLN